MATKSPIKEGVIETQLQEVIVKLQERHEKIGLKISQSQIAREAGMAYLTVHGFFHNKSTPSLSSLYRIADAINKILAEKDIREKVHPKDFLI